MSFCDKKINMGNICISHEDYYMILLNIFVIIILGVVIYLKIKENKAKLNKTVNVRNNFTMLGDGPLNLFYTTNTIQQKSSQSKKKVANKILNVNEKNTNNELKCNNCNRTVDLSYQYTISKLQN
jgi:hypothetical protein